MLKVPFLILHSPLKNGAMTMETDLNLNGKRLLNYNPQSKAVIFGQYTKGTRGQPEKFIIK